MAYLTNLEKIREIYGDKALKVEEEAEARRFEVHATVPQIAVIDRRLAEVGMSLFDVMMHEKDIYTAVNKLKDETLDLNARRRELLVAHGYAPDYTDPHYACDKCKDTGYVKGKMCGCMRQALIRENMKTSGLGEALLETCTFDNFSLSYYHGDHRVTMENNLKIAKSYASTCLEKRENLLLYGGTGLGKTHLSTAIAKDALDRGLNVFYNTTIGMIADFSSAKFNAGAFDGDAVNVSQYTACQLLILDDLGTEAVNSFSTEVLYYVLSYRINNGLATVVNTNLKNKEIVETYNDRIYSRLYGHFTLLPFEGLDIRRQKVMGKA